MGVLTNKRIGVAVLALAAGGCERSDPQSRAIGEASNTMLATGVGGSSPAPRATLDKNFKQVLATLKEGGDGDDATKAIMAALGGNALGGQGEIAAAGFREADGHLLSAVGEAKARLGLYVEQRSLATALDGYDPEADVARFDAAMKEREKALVAAERALDDVKKRVETTRGKAKGKADQGRGMMERLGGLRQRLMDASSEDRPGLAAELNKARREAEGVMKESELLEAEAETISPLLIERSLAVEEVERQIASLEVAKSRARELAASRAAGAAEATKGAEQTGAEVAQVIAEVRRVLAEEVKPAYESAAAMFNQEAAKYSQSRNGPDQKLLKLTAGSAAQSIGALHREYAASLGRVGQVLALAGKIQPEIEGAEEFRAAAEAIEGERKQALAAALEQYDKARSAFESGGSGDLRERLEALSARVTEAWVALGGTPPEEPKAEEPPPAEEVAPAPEAEGEVQPAKDPAPETESAPESAETPPPPEEPNGPPPGR